MRTLRGSQAPFRGFTLMELLVTIAILAVLAAFISSSLPGVKERAKISKRTSDLRQIVTAMISYSGENQGFFPVSGGTVFYGAEDPTTGRPGWQEQLNPYIENSRKLFAGPDPKLVDENVYRTAYFNGSHAAYKEAEDAGLAPKFQPVQMLKIEQPSKYILAGEIRNGNFNQRDADADNYTQEPAFDGQSEKVPVALAFADGHVGVFKEFDENLMMITYGPEPAN